jgi:hypothetical protein
MKTQAHLPAMLGALHNFICDNDSAVMSDLEDDNENEDWYELHPHASTGDLADDILGRAERRQADDRCDRIVRPYGRTTGERSTRMNMDLPPDILPWLLRVFCTGSFDICFS